LFISGYGEEYAAKLGRTPTIVEYLSTRIHVYDIRSIGQLLLIAQQDVHGHVVNAYSEGEFVHIVTRSSINALDNLVKPLTGTEMTFQGTDDASYRKAATELVEDGLLDQFAEDLVDDLQVSGPVDFARLSFFTDSVAPDNHNLYYSGSFNSISQIVSFDMSAIFNKTTSVVGMIEPNMAAVFHPGSSGRVYAVGSMIIVADEGWSWNPDENRSSEKTFLVCFSLSGASSTYARVGTTEGTLLSPSSLDYVEKSSGNYVRVATTQTFSIDESPSVNQVTVLKVPSESTAPLEFVGSVEFGETNRVRR